MARKISVEIIGDSRSLERAFGRAGKAGGRFGSTMRNLGRIAAVGLGGGLLAAGFALRRGFAELSEAQKVAAQTRAVLKSTGGVANVTAKQVDTLSTSLSRMSGIDDEAVAAGQNMLLTFTNIRNGLGKNNKVFDMATKAVLDTSVALGRDIPTTAIMVGKALNDLEVNTKGTITGWSALRRVGVKVTKDTMAQGAAFIAAGKPMEAQKLLLRELMTEFGGSAKAFGTTMPGALGKLSNAFDELMAAFAQGFLPLILKVAKVLTTKLADPAFVARVRELGTLVGTKLYNAFAAVGNWFVANWPNIQTGFRITGQVLGIVVQGVEKLVAAFKVAAPIIAALIQHSLILPLKIVLAIWSGILEGISHIPLVGGKVKGALDAVNKAREGVRATEQRLNEVREGGGQQRPRGRGRPRAGNKGFMGREGGGRATGGPVMPGVAYRVGERGPEMFVPAAAGNVLAGGGGQIVVPVYLDGRQIAQVVTPHIARIAKRSSAQTRGRHAGLNLGFS